MHASDPPRSLRLRRSFGKTLSIYPRSAPGALETNFDWFNFTISNRLLPTRADYWRNTFFIPHSYSPPTKKYVLNSRAGNRAAWLRDWVTLRYSKGTEWLVVSSTYPHWLRKSCKVTFAVGQQKLDFGSIAFFSFIISDMLTCARLKSKLLFSPLSAAYQVNCRSSFSREIIWLSETWPCTCLVIFSQFFLSCFCVNIQSLLVFTIFTVLMYT